MKKVIKITLYKNLIFTKLFLIKIIMRKIKLKIITFINFYIKFYLLRDEFTIAVSKWKKDLGESLRYDYSLTKDSIVFDLGGYRGDFAYGINKRYNSIVYVFEPNKQYYDHLLKRFYNNPKIRLFNYAISNKDGVAFLSQEEDASSIFKNKMPGTKINLQEFKSQFNIFGLNKIDLCKINVEGAEYPILLHLLEFDLIKKIKYLQIQFHNFYPNAVNLRKIIREELSKTHVEQYNYPFVWESWSLK
jgi:FkbM family methyltransferase